jgi:hypothetical protein
MHQLLWVLQILFGLYFVAIGFMHFVVPDGRAGQRRRRRRDPDRGRAGHGHPGRQPGRDELSWPR